MALENAKRLDETGWRLLQELRRNARLSYAELGRRVGLSLPSVTDRVRKMEEAGIITGYQAEIDLAKLDIPVLAIVHLRGIGGRSCQEAVARVTEIPETLECYRVTGDDSIIVKVAATSLDHLARVIDQLSLSGVPSTSIVRSKPMKRQTIPHEILERGEDEKEGPPQRFA
jgi:Lrp/AsnC family transcriptional regulator, leucine-responsive regulatory protein